ncbi:MAG: fluoride efflux transporter CrcB [Tumebacillaceae bacterium]
MRARLYLAVSLGGGIGAVLRWSAGAFIAGGPSTTMGINWIGCFVLGFFTTWAVKRVPETVRVGVGTGVLGGFTTFSTFSVETLRLLQAGDVTEAALYAGASLVGGVLLAALGVRLARKGAGA